MGRGFLVRAPQAGDRPGRAARRCPGLDRTLAVAAPGADLLLVHWRGSAPEAQRGAAATSEMVAARPELETVVAHTDRHFLLHVLRRS